MTNRMDIVTPRAGSDGKTYWTKVGVAFATRDGGWSLSFEALPLPAINDKGALECRALLMPPREKQDAPPQRQQSRATPRRRDDLDEDDCPF